MLGDPAAELTPERRFPKIEARILFGGFDGIE